MLRAQTTRLCDVLVVGAGVAGISAAVRASREGADTILIEKNAHAGGIAVIGMHRFICGLYGNGDDLPDGTLNGGLAAEICEALKERSPAREVRRMGKVHVLPFGTRELVSSFQSLTEAESRLEILYETRARSVRMEKGAIASVTVADRMGEFEISPRAVVDCSGDGSIVQMSGARRQLSPANERQLAGYSFRVTGLWGRDELLPVKVPYHLAKAADEGKMPSHLRFTTYTSGDGPGEGYCGLNVPPTGEEATDQARKDALLAHRHLSEVLEAFKGSRIADMSPEVVFREGPRVCGEYTLSGDDVLKARKFPDGAVKNAWPIELWDQQTGPSHQYLEPGDYYEIPLRCLKARDVSNCWCAGRCISATREALGSTRVMGTCISLGEQAGREAAQHIQA
jgi:2-polyprenyl-6-methoxyphenol hydroxylase-like FAD-dependent oxidoreductase